MQKLYSFIHAYLGKHPTTQSTTFSTMQGEHNHGYKAKHTLHNHNISNSTRTYFKQRI